MLPTKPDLVVLPFMARRIGSDAPLTLDQTLALIQTGEQIQIARSHPGAPEAIGWTIFRRTRTQYLYENELLFCFERSARRHVRSAYARHYALNKEDDLTHTHLDP